MTDWIYRSHLIVVASDRIAANVVAQTIGPEGESESDTFSVALTPDSLTTTHYGCSSLITAEMLVAMRDALADNALPSLIYYRLDASDDTLVATNSATAQASIGSPWTWQDSLNDVGVQTHITMTP